MHEENDDERKTFLYNPNGAHGGIGYFIVRDCRSSAPEVDLSVGVPADKVVIADGF